MLIAMTKIRLNIGEGRQGVVLCVCNELADGRNVGRVDMQHAARVAENIFPAISEVCEGGRWTAVGVGRRVVNLPRDVVFIQQLEDGLGCELRRVVVKSGIEDVTLRSAAGPSRSEEHTSELQSL